MSQTVAYAFGSVAVVSLISLVGVIALALSNRLLNRTLIFLVALSTGALFGDVFFHLLPEIYEKAGSNPSQAAFYILLGLFTFFVLEKFLHWTHHHHNEDCPECSHHPKPFGYLNLLSDGLHNLIDGFIIAAAYLVSLEAGIATTIAVILHEIPQEVGDFGILVQAGFSKARALLFNLLSASLAILGVAATLLINQISLSFNAFLLPLTAGSLLYIAGSDLVPELHKTTDWKKSIGQFIALLVGAGLMFILTTLELS